MTKEIVKPSPTAEEVVLYPEINNLEGLFELMLAAKINKAEADAEMKLLAIKAGRIKQATKGKVDHEENEMRKRDYMKRTATHIYDHLEAQVNMFLISDEDANSAFEFAMQMQDTASDHLISAQVTDMESS